MAGAPYFDYDKKVWRSASGRSLRGQYTDVSPMTPAPQVNQGQQQPYQQPYQQPSYGTPVRTTTPPRNAPLPNPYPGRRDPFGTYGVREANHGYQFGTAPGNNTNQLQGRRSSPTRRQLYDRPIDEGQLDPGQRHLRELEATRWATEQREQQDRERRDRAAASAAAAAAQPAKPSFADFQARYTGPRR